MAVLTIGALTHGHSRTFHAMAAVETGVGTGAHTGRTAARLAVGVRETAVNMNTQ